MKHGTWAIVASAVALGGCAGVPKGPGAQAGNAIDAYALFHGDGTPAAWEELVARASSCDVVLIGEEHDNAHGQALAARLFEEILARTDRAALSLEFLTRDDQARVDDYLAGFVGPENDYPNLSKYPAGHVRMIDAAREAGVPVIAANAPRRYVRTASRRGYDALAAVPEGRRSLFVVPEPLPGGTYRERFIELMSSGMHGDSDGAPIEERRARAERSFLGQALWDATMADSIARALARGRRPVVHVVGRFHTDHGGGTVQMLRRYAPEAEVVVVSVAGRPADAVQEEDAGAADFIVYAP